VYGLRYARRYGKIASTLMRHGFGWLVASAGLGAVVPFHWGILGHSRRHQRYSGPEHLRMAFEELGPTFIKMAQILSTRPDLVSPAYAEEFSRLTDRVHPLPFEPMRDVLDAELGFAHKQVFPVFDPEPLASASIGQVYRAELSDGTKVVVKIQKPGVAESAAMDLEILKNAVARISRRTGIGERYDLRGILDEFAFFLLNELDYVQEAKNADRFRSIFKDDPRIFIPWIYWDFTSPRVLVMDEMRGIKANELDTCHPCPDIDRPALAAAAMEAVFKEMFEHGFFHADPHPGNFIIMEGPKLGLMDFGLVGTLERPQREAFLRFIYQMVRGDTEEMMDALWDLGISGRFAGRPALKRDLNHLVHRFKESSLGDLAAGDLVHEIMTTAYRHQLSFPPDLAMLFKVLAMTEGLGAMLDPGFKFFENAEPYLKRQYGRLLSPRNIMQDLEKDAAHLLSLGRGLPQRVSRLLRRLELGDIELSIRHEGLDRKSDTLTRSLDRLTVSILLALLLIAAGIYVLAGHFMGFDYYMVNLLLGFLIACALGGARLLYGIWRTRK
jgi:ubiquinone biosynthesis protein